MSCFRALGGAHAHPLDPLPLLFFCAPLQTSKALKSRPMCKGVCGCTVSGTAKAWLVCCVPLGISKPVSYTVTLELTMSSLTHYGHAPSTASDTVLCSAPYAPAAVKFCDQVRRRLKDGSWFSECLFVCVGGGGGSVIWDVSLMLLPYMMLWTWFACSL